jgi:hypothetical protein
MKWMSVVTGIILQTKGIHLDAYNIKNVKYLLEFDPLMNWDGDSGIYTIFISLSFSDNEFL